jgi:hypothetical protein
MPLPRKFKRHTFAICFGISLFPFVAINSAMYIAAINCCSGDGVMDAGFPLKWYVGSWVDIGVIWEAFVLDVMLALTASVISAKILKLILQPNE